MKKTILLLLVIFAFGCDKDDSPETLPEATQTGRGIFACYVDGKPFIDNSGGLNCFYQLVDGGYYFGIQGNDVIDSLNSIILATNKKAIAENQTYYLLSNSEDNVYGGAGFFISSTSYELSLTDQSHSGQLIITKFDIQNQIVSGTFWFNIKNPFTEVTVYITQGRFDAHFTQ